MSKMILEQERTEFFGPSTLAISPPFEYEPFVI